ncbi:S-adenosyl-L-methionine-dependent methyltransferase [Hesseltinella vesiculosa]|uniref:S-adenosyl-L-methionine-dependent methyltransferase n=1 Tax=Hesseltinella vesiculosa TaxID=101127 RepID=A0A1X2GXB9_9FUNG|nr:S-adenosyl-L-methionine-dependent methyltransferase [Hesseltinella vesiculosa]
MGNATYHLLCHVPEGFEKIAMADLEEQLSSVTSLDIIQCIGEEGTGRVHAFAKSTADGQALYAALISMSLPCSYDLMLVAGTLNLTREVYDDPMHGVLGGALEKFTASLPWRDLIGPVSPEAASPTTFRATFHKDQLSHHTKSADLAGHLGHAFGQLHPGWKVNLTKFDYNIVGMWSKHDSGSPLLAHAPACSPPSSLPILLVHVGLSIPIPDSKYRNRIHFGHTSLNTPIAACLVRLADPQPGQIIFDMCCGTGTIPIEGAAQYPWTLWLGGEVKVKTLSEKAKENAAHANVLGSVELFLCDGRKMNLRDGCIDMVLSGRSRRECNWPWGLRENSFVSIEKLYPKFFKQMHRVLRPGGRAIIVSQATRLLKRVMGYSWMNNLFVLERQFTIRIGGLPVSVYMIVKKGV